MSRELTAHKVNGCNEAITVAAVGDPGPGGACHHYRASCPGSENGPPSWAINLPFQNGPIKEAGVNGVTHEALLAIVVDRLQSFQKGPYACRENAIALTKLEEAVHWLQHRTQGPPRPGRGGDARRLTGGAMDFPSLVVGLWLGVVLCAAGVAIGLWLGDRRVEQRRRLAADGAPRDVAPPVCGGADDTPADDAVYHPDDDADWWKKGGRP
jgi:hypothetical protein